MVGKGLETDLNKGDLPGKLSAEGRIFHLFLLQGFPDGSEL